MKDLDRRQLLRGASALGGGAALSALLPAWAQSGTPGIASTLPTVSGETIRRGMWTASDCDWVEGLGSVVLGAGFSLIVR